MGWQSRSGEKRAKIETYDDLRDKVLPKTSELTITMTAGEGDSIEMRVSHHDAPTGEFYTLTPIEPLATGDKVKITDEYINRGAGWMGKEVKIVSFDGSDQYDDGVMTYTDDEPKVGWPDEKEADGPMDHAEGSGTEQAGTGDAEGQIPDRKDLHDDMVEPKEYTDESFDINEAIAQFQGILEQEDEGEEGEEDDEEGEEGEEDDDAKKNLT
jgi:hypothetical protein